MTLLTVAGDGVDSGSVVVRRLCAQVGEVKNVAEMHIFKTNDVCRPDRSDTVAFLDRLHLILVVRVV